MPFPLLAIGAAVTTVVVAIVEAVGKKTIVAAALVAALVALYVGFTAAVNGVINAIPINTMPVWLATGISILPTNTDDCLGVIYISYLSRLIFDSGRAALGIRAAS